MFITNADLNNPKYDKCPKCGAGLEPNGSMIEPGWICSGAFQGSPKCTYTEKCTYEATSYHDCPKCGSWMFFNKKADGTYEWVCGNEIQKDPCGYEILI